LSKDIVKGLDLICFRNLTNDSSDVLAQRKFADLISEFSKLYDFIVINTPSVLSSADAIMYAKFTGLNLCVVRKKISSLSQVDSVVNRYIQSGKNLHGFVFNDA
jgi:tyrosine-protein kinase Etk/Wzc